MRYLLDTCVILELIAKQPNDKVVVWIDNLPDEQVYLTVITIGEIQRGIQKLPESHRQETLHHWLEEELLHRFMERILPIDLKVMLTWGTLVAQLEAHGRVLPAMNSLIAAITLTHNMQLVTRNEKDFADTKVPILNPWT